MPPSVDASLPQDVYPLMRKMRDTFDEIMHILQQDEHRVRKGYMLLQEERDAMLRDISAWHNQRPDRVIPSVHRQDMPTTTEADHTVSAPPAPRHSPHAHDMSLFAESSCASSLPASDRATPPANHQTDENRRYDPRPSVRLERRTTEAFGTSPPTKRAPPSPPRLRSAITPPSQVDEAVRSAADVPTSWPIANLSAADADRLSPSLTRRSVPYTDRQESQAPYETLHARQRDAVLRERSILSAESRERAVLPHRSSPVRAPSHAGSRTATFWINVWPCFGTFSSTCRAAERVLVTQHYRYMEDVTEVASKALHCQPAPLYLYEADGRLIRDVASLRPDHHYLLFPSGGRYREDCVPLRLLELLVTEAKNTLLYDDARESRTSDA